MTVLIHKGFDINQEKDCLEVIKPITGNLHLYFGSFDRTIQAVGFIDKIASPQDELSVSPEEMTDELTDKKAAFEEVIFKVKPL